MSGKSQLKVMKAFKLTPEENRKFTDLASKRRVPLSLLIRQLLWREVESPKESQ